MSDDNPPADHVLADDNKMGNPIGENLKSGTTWTRFLFMLISWVLLSVAMFAGTVIVILGFFWVLFSGEINRQVQGAGQSIAKYIYNVCRYLTYNMEERPYPLGGEWPSPGKEEK